MLKRGPHTIPRPVSCISDANSYLSHIAVSYGVVYGEESGRGEKIRRGRERVGGGEDGDRQSGTSDSSASLYGRVGTLLVVSILGRMSFSASNFCFSSFLSSSHRCSHILSILHICSF